MPTRFPERCRSCIGAGFGIWRFRGRAARASRDCPARFADTIDGVSQRNLTWEPTGVIEYVIPADWLGGADAARWRGNPAIDFVAGLERNWSNISAARYSQWRVGIVFKTGWRF
jgi:hypothetical protein